MFGVEGVLHLDGNIFHTDGIDRRRVDHFRTEVTEFHGLHIREFVDGIGTFDHLRVSRHEAIHIRPYLQYLGIQHGGDDGGGIVRTATPEVRRLVGVAVSGDEAGHHINLVCCCATATYGTEGLLHQLLCLLGVKHVLTLFLLRTDKVAAVHADTVLHHRGHDVRTQSLTITDDGVFRLLREVVNQIDTVEDALQLVEELIYIIE